MLEYTNLIFTCTFGIEMVLKIVAEGMEGYIRNGFNVFDGFIVIIRFFGVFVSFGKCLLAQKYSVSVFLTILKLRAIFQRCF